MKKEFIFGLCSKLLIFGLICSPTVLMGHQSDGEATRFSRIEEAYNQGEIDYETALVSKVFAIFQPEKLAKRFQIEGLQPEKCATPLFFEIQSNWSGLSPGTREILGPYLLRPTEPDGEEPYGHPYETEAESYDTPSGHLKIWYVTSTDDAPDLTDMDPQDGVPDWINRCGEIFDHVWTQEIEGMGYLQPPEDGGDLYPQGQDYGGDSKYDVYVEDLGERIFGYTQSEYGVSNKSYTSYIVVDNDYEWYPSYNRGKQPIDALKVTAAHEFFHAIHFGYDARELSDRWWMEISAVWMEDKMYDSVNDYFAYLPWFFSDPGISLDTFNGIHEYASCIWAMFLDQKYGTEIIRDMWEGCVSASALSAMQSALSNRGSSLADAFKTFTVWNYFTGSRANPDTYYEEGAYYSEVKFKAHHSSYPASGTGALDHLAAHYIGFQPHGESGGLRTFFDGSTDATWGAMIIEYQNRNDHFVHEIDLADQSSGSHSTRNWNGYKEIVLIPSIISIKGNNYTYMYEGEYDPLLGAKFELSEMYLDFNTLYIGESAERELIMYNRSVDLLTIYSISINPDSSDLDVFELQNIALLPVEIEGNESMSVGVRFHPTQFGKFEGELVITTDDTLMQTVKIGLSGFATVHDVLLQNFPHPFKTWEERQRTYFPFNLSKTTEVTITIHSLAGQLVKTLSLGEQEPGQHKDRNELESMKAFWDGTNEIGENVASGIYLYTIKAGNFVETKKMAVIR